METDAKCPACGAELPQATAGDEPSAVPQPASCPSCGARLSSEPGLDSLERSGWHSEDEPQA